MKRILSIVLALSILVGLAACGAAGGSGQSNSGQGSGASAGSTGSGSQSGTGSGSGSQSGNSNPEGAKLTGKLNFINLDDRDPSVLRGVTVYGNRAGTKDFNSKDPATEGIRCIFELNEYFGFIPDTDAKYGIKVWVLKHRDDQEYYNKAKFSDLMSGFAEVCTLNFDTDNPENNYWGETYLNPGSCEEGYYDFVFVYEGKAIATMLTRFYKEGSLESKSDADLEALMHG